MESGNSDFYGILLSAFRGRIIFQDRPEFNISSRVMGNELTLTNAQDRYSEVKHAASLQFYVSAIIDMECTVSIVMGIVDENSVYVADIYKNLMMSQQLIRLGPCVVTDYLNGTYDFKNSFCLGIDEVRMSNGEGYVLQAKFKFLQGIKQMPPVALQPPLPTA